MAATQRRENVVPTLFDGVQLSKRADRPQWDLRGSRRHQRRAKLAEPLHAESSPEIFHVRSLPKSRPNGSAEM